MHAAMSPEVPNERLLAFVPRPRRHLVTCYGGLAPAAGLRSRVVPKWSEEEDASENDDVDAAEAEVSANGRPRSVCRAPIDGPRSCRS